MPAAYLKVFLQHAVSEKQSIEELLDGTDLQTGELPAGDQAVSFAATTLRGASAAQVVTC